MNYEEIFYRYLYLTFHIYLHLFINCFLSGIQLGIEKIRRAAAPNDHPIFIDALTDIVASHLRSNKPITPKFMTRCPHCVNKNCGLSKDWYEKNCQL